MEVENTNREPIGLEETRTDAANLRQQDSEAPSSNSTAGTAAGPGDRVRCGENQAHPAQSGGEKTESQMKDEAKAEFWRWMKWVVPILLSTVVIFYIYMLTSLVKPVLEFQIGLRQLQSDFERLREDNLSKKPEKRVENAYPQEVTIIMIIQRE